MDKKISKNRIKKEEVVKELLEKVKKAKGIVLTNYEGLKHKDIEELKKALKTHSAEYVVTKNTLLKLALQNNQLSAISHESRDKAFEEPTGTLFMYADIVEPLKSLAKTIKSLSLPTVKLGILENQTLNGEEVLKLSTLPSKQQLIAQFVGALKSPLYGIHSALNWNIQKLIMTLSAIEKTKA